MIDWCHRHGLKFSRPSPSTRPATTTARTTPSVRLALEPATIAVSPRDLPDLTAAEFRTGEAGDAEGVAPGAGRIYPKVKPLKLALLRAAFEAFPRKSNSNAERPREGVRRFSPENAHWLDNYSLYRVLMEENRELHSWERWPSGHRTPDAAQAWLAALPEIERAAFLRGTAILPIRAMDRLQPMGGGRAHADAKGVYLMGDVPFGVGRCSADAWAYPGDFRSRMERRRAARKNLQSGPVHRKWGQNWGIPNLRLGRAAQTKFRLVAPAGLHAMP